jgi:uncharacterized membrane protein
MTSSPAPSRAALSRSGSSAVAPDVGRPAPVVDAPTRADAVVRALSGAVGGPAGRRLASGTTLWRALPVLVLMAALMMAGGVIGKGSCRSHGWNSPDQFVHACYSDIAVLYASAGLGSSHRPSLVDAISPDVPGGPARIGQPPLTGAAIWAVSAGIDDKAPAGPRRFFDLSAVALTGVLALAVVAVVLTAGRRRRWDGAHLAMAPVLLTVGLLNYDLLAVAFAAWALWAWSRSRPLTTGVLLGGAVLCRPVLAMLLVALFGACLRAGRLGAWTKVALVTGGLWVAARVVLFESPLSAMSSTWTAWRGSTPGYGTLWLVPQLVVQNQPKSSMLWYHGPAFSALGTTLGSLLGLILVAGLTIFLALAAPYRPRVAHLALFVMTGSLLANKSLPPQASLLLLPLIALAGLRWRDHLIWAGAEIAYFIGLWEWIAVDNGAAKGAPGGLYLALLLIRCAAIGYLGFQAARAAWRPWHDPVRVPDDPVDTSNGEDDPAGGLLSMRPDAVVARLR